MKAHKEGTPEGKQLQNGVLSVKDLVVVHILGTTKGDELEGTPTALEVESGPKLTFIITTLLDKGFVTPEVVISMCIRVKVTLANNRGNRINSHNDDNSTEQREVHREL